MGSLRNHLLFPAVVLDIFQLLEPYTMKTTVNRLLPLCLSVNWEWANERKYFVKFETFWNFCFLFFVLKIENTRLTFFSLIFWSRVENTFSSSPKRFSTETAKVMQHKKRWFSVGGGKRPLQNVNGAYNVAQHAPKITHNQHTKSSLAVNWIALNV